MFPGFGGGGGSSGPSLPSWGGGGGGRGPSYDPYADNYFNTFNDAILTASGPTGALIAAGRRSKMTDKNASGGGGGGGGGAPQTPIKNLADLKTRMGEGGTLGLPELVQAMPDYQGIRDDKGNLLDPYKFDYSGSKGYERMSDMALSKGPTDMYDQSANVIDLNTNRAVSDLALQNATGVGNAMGNLAMSGGIDSGARERVQNAGTLSRLQGAQDLYAGGAGQKASALLADTQMKNQMLGTVTGYDVNAENLNKNAAINDLYNKNQGDLAAWGKLGDIYGSDQTSQAMLAAANKEDPGFFGMGGALGTGLGGNQGLGGSGFGSKSWDDRTIRNPMRSVGINPGPNKGGGQGMIRSFY